MSQKSRLIIAITVLVLIIVVVLGVDALRRREGGPTGTSASEPALAPGSIPIHLDGEFVGAFNPADAEALEMVSFKDQEEGKKQEGWLLRDVILVHVDGGKLDAEARVVVLSSSRDKAAELTWSEVDDPANWVMFDLASEGTLKLVSTLERLDTRDEWVQDVDGIEVTLP